MWTKIKNFFREVGIIMASIADASMEYEAEKTHDEDYREDVGPM